MPCVNCNDPFWGEPLSVPEADRLIAEERARAQWGLPTQPVEIRAGKAYLVNVTDETSRNQEVLARALAGK